MGDGIDILTPCKSLSFIFSTFAPSTLYQKSDLICVYENPHTQKKEKENGGKSFLLSINHGVKTYSRQERVWGSFAQVLEDMN